jgi:hypothetical protein
MDNEKRLNTMLAKAIHDVHIEINEYLNDPTPAPPFHSIPRGKRPTVNMVDLIRKGYEPPQVHQAWVDWMISEGWQWGEVKSHEKKTHPSMVPWDKLSMWDRKKVLVAHRIVYTILFEE